LDYKRCPYQSVIDYYSIAVAFSIVEMQHSVHGVIMI